jgi:hypothetical protein
VLALQIWWLLTPRAESLLLRRSGFTWWQMKLAIEATELCIVAIIGVLVTDLQWSGGPVVELLRPTAAIELALLAAAIVIVSTGQRWQRILALQRQLRGLWRTWNWGARIVGIALILHIGLISKSLLGYWEQTSGLFLAHEAVHSTALSPTGKILCNFDFFCQICLDKIPEDARILYCGGNEGLIMAFELYPRCVFMLPQEQREMFHDCWRNEIWCRGMAADPLDECWRWDPPTPSIDQAQFMQEHGITHIIRFDPLNASSCQIQDVR